MSADTSHPPLSPEACRAARAILRWSVADLVHEANVSPNSVQKIESGDPVRQTTVDRIISAFKRNGVETVGYGAQRKR
ncbi:MAG TPA: helix-turn-helix transcriptional regulator [Caulobacteraceae bacterium]|nr:helix-turn-helix transcriptional regulator [Caulobacteraceae bacterium]